MSFLGEVRRRKIFQVAAVYAVVSWLLIQIVATVAPLINLPDWTATLVVVLLAIGFPITLVMSWGFNLTAEGVVAEGAGSAPQATTGFKIEYLLFAVIAIALMWLVYRVEFDRLPPVQDLATDEQIVDEAAVDPFSDALPNSIAVLPFENLSPDPDNAYFAAGIHESTLNQLAKIRDLAVLSRSTVMQFSEDRPPIPEIAETLKVETVMEGSVRYADGRVLITAQLIDGRSDTHLWSAEFNRELTDVFAVQAEVAEQIAAALEIRLLPEEQTAIGKQLTTSAEAYRYYLRSLSLPWPNLYPELLPVHVDLLSRAIEADPQFAEAYSQLAWIYYSSPERSRAAEYAEKAIGIDPAVGQAYFVLGMRDRYYYDRQESARAAFERAINLSPRDPRTLMGAYRHLSEQTGEFEDAIRVGREAIRIDSRNDQLYWILGFILMRAGDSAAAVEQFEEAARIDPSDYVTQLDLAIAQYLNGDRAAAKEDLDRLTHMVAPGVTFRLDYLAYLYGLLGEPERAATLLAEKGASPENPQSDVWETLGWAVLGTRDKDNALRVWTATIDGYINNDEPVSLGRITRFRDNWLNDPILEEPEFVDLRRRLGYEG